MPKVTINKKASQRASEDKILVALINKNLTILGMQKKELAVRIHMGESTLHARCRRPGTFRRSELQDIFDVLHFSEADKAQIKW